ncbi:MAG TPA: MlaD family protein [Candidatus Dormibacteraeota bacterium]|jgi:phospholipid/cholesterol/gamma-HCH transport system substrate-binding protein|nr:MlaD family protein [Candidatus Dormibacteraeota bacterium]
MSRRPLTVGLGVAALLAVVLVVALAAPGLAGRSPHRVSITLAQSASGLVAGSDVLEAGAKVGSVSSIEPAPDGHARIQVDVADANWPLHRGVTVGIRPRSLLGEKYVDLQDGPASAPAYDPATPLQASATAVPVELDTFLNSLDPTTRAATRSLIGDLGAGLAGTGADLNTAIAAARSNLENLAKTGSTLNGRDADLDRILVGLDGVLAKLTQDDQLTQMQQLITNGQKTLNAVESARADFSRQFVDSQAVLTDLNAAVDPAVGSLRDLIQRAPSLVTQLQSEAALLAQVGQSFSDSTLQAFEQSLLRGPTSTGGALETVPAGTTPLGTGLPIFRICLITPTPGSCTGNGYTPAPTRPAATMYGGGAGELLTLAGYIGA